MSAAVLPMRSANAYDPKVGDEVICTRDGARGFVQRVFLNKLERPSLASVQVQGGGGIRLLPVIGFRRAPAKAQA